MPAVTRELEITYGGFVVSGADDNYLLTGRYQQDEGYPTGVLSFTVLCRADTETDFGDKCIALEAAFRKPWQATKVKLGAKTLIDWTHVGNTGYNAQPTIRKIGDDDDSGRARKYAITVTVELPADLAGQSARRYSSVALTTDPSGRRARLEISGRYTALGGLSARAAYEAAIAAYVSAVQASIPITGAWQKVAPEIATADDQNKNLDFSIAYEEVPAGEADSGLLDVKLSISRSRPAPGDSPGRGTRRLTTFRAVVSGQVPFGLDARTRWETVTRAWIIGKIRTIFGITTLAIAPDDLDIDHVKNEIHATLTALGPEGGKSLEYTHTQAITDDKGVTIAPVWNSDPLAAYRFSSPETVVRTTTDVERVLGDEGNPAGGASPGGGAGIFGVGIDLAGGVGVRFGVPGGGSRGGSLVAGIDIGGVGVRFRPAAGGAAGAGAPGVGVGAAAGGDIWELISTSEQRTVLNLGLPGESFVVTDKTSVKVERLRHQPPAGEPFVRSGRAAHGGF